MSRSAVRAPYCDFCVEFAELGDKGALPRVAWHTADQQLLALPSLGGLCDGHVMIMSRAHYTAFLGAQTVKGLLSNAVCGARQAVRGQFGPTVVFEHGSIAEGSSGGCGCTHAHLHIVPCKWTGHLPGDNLFWTNVDYATWIQLQQESYYSDYLLFSPRENDWYVAQVDQIKSQWMRKQIAAVIGTEEWDWRKRPNRAGLLRTLAWMRSVVPPDPFVVSE